MANHLKPELRAAVVRCLIDGVGVRATARITGVNPRTVLRIVLEVGGRCAALHDALVRGVHAPHIEVDELWGFVAKKDAQVTEDDPPTAGSAYHFVAMGIDARLILAWRIGPRELPEAVAFMTDVASRLSGRSQVTTDGWPGYPDAVEQAFGRDVDYAVISKSYAAHGAPEDRRYSAGRVKWQRKAGRVGHPDMDRVCSSHIERLNLSARLHNRRLARLTTCFSRSWDHHVAAFALWAVAYNLIKPHASLDGLTPAQAAGLVSSPWEVEDLLAWEGAEASAA